MSLVMGMILPGIVLNWAVEDPEPQAEQTQPPGNPAPEMVSPEPMEVRLRTSDGTIRTMQMDEYLTGVILGEIPSTFHQEARKAQAVAARTFAYKASITQGKHGDGSVCADPGCCQAYIDPEEYLFKGGTEKALAAAREAAEATSGFVIYYGEELIEATYFSCSGGYTEDAVEVWGADVEYLRSMPSPGEENAVHYTDSFEFSRKELEAKLGITLSGDPEDWVKDITYTAGGGVDSLTIGGECFRGTEVRSLLSLRSTVFTVTPMDDSIRLDTRGFGHRVGMSQYGADAMARKGSTWQEILAHYYQGTTLELTNSAG